MGYHTNFSGEFVLNKPLTQEHAAYLKRFNETRRMKRDAKKAAKLPDPIREAAGLGIGIDAAYFVGGVGFAGQEKDASIVNHNGPPEGQPGLWCQWTPNEDGTAIEWDSGEKFYDYIDWLHYIIEHFLNPWGYTLNGEVSWSGESPGDCGIMSVKDNVVEIKDDIVEIEE